MDNNEVKEVIDNNFGKAFAIAWSENQGNYSSSIAKKTLNFALNQGLKINTVLDICCGSANFLSEMQDHGKICTGTEILDSYVEYNRSKYSGMTFVKTETVDDIDNLGTYDLISCNHDVVNYLPTLERWGSFFKKVYNHLNNGGIFIFDFYTKRKLQYWNEVTSDENDKLDYIKKVESDGETKTVISNIYYINIDPKQSSNVIGDDDSPKNNKYKKTENSDIEYFFENDAILNQVKKAGYRYLITTDANFAPVSSISDMNRMHIIAIKREG